MTQAQIDDLLIEWNLYTKNQQALIFQEFQANCEQNCSDDDFLAFLRQKLQIDGYWKKVGII
ncbi:hypothetical protein [Desulforhopalus sp. IMCC35007]|uniref:hypothetical protein n=1 Tax=Desulforhopalus sp. IMCC35007 TaxID=2569543 RepID=UPI0010AE6ED1|nr:hypothetical protein [Desulforhopalus sp. IMCC35007]TKB07200.1 hypothetical protein FCL48_18350 [Desulforhopalus sp. IMCC35007]